MPSFFFSGLKRSGVYRIAFMHDGPISYNGVANAITFKHDFISTDRASQVINIHLQQNSSEVIQLNSVNTLVRFDHPSSDPQIVLWCDPTNSKGKTKTVIWWYSDGSKTKDGSNAAHFGLTLLCWKR